MEIRFAEDGDLEAMIRFNQRLKDGGRGEEQMTLQPSLPGEARYRPAGFPVYRRMMIAEDGREIRAAMLLHHHSVFIKGERRDFCWADMPVSEGIVNRKYSLAIVQLMKRATAYQPKLRYAALLGAFSGAGAGLSGLLSLRRHLASFLSTCQSSVERAFAEFRRLEGRHAGGRFRARGERSGADRRRDQLSG